MLNFFSCVLYGYSVLEFTKAVLNVILEDEEKFEDLKEKDKNENNEK